MRIGQVAHRYLPSIGGIENYTYRLARDLSRCGHSVEIFTTTRHPSQTPGGVEVHSVSAMLPMSTNPIPIGLFKMLRASNLDLVHFQSPWYLTSILPLLHDFRPSTVMTVHGLLPERRSLPRDIALGLLYVPALNALGKCSAVVTLTATERAKIERLFPLRSDKLHTIPNGIDPDCCGHAGKSRTPRSIRAQPSILWVGRASKDSGTERAIRAFVRIRQHNPDVDLTLAGPGTDELVSRLRPGLPLSVREGITGTGIVTRSALCELYSSHTIFISLGTWEGLPTRVLEAMLHGCVPLVTESGGMTDVISDGENGVLISNADEETVATTVQHMLARPDRLDHLSNAAMATVRERYLWPNIFGELLSLYRRVTEQ